MFRSLVRFTGFALAGAGFVFLMLDGIRSIAASRLLLSQFGETWQNVSPTTLQNTQAALEKNVAVLWDPILLTLLLTPTSMLLMGFGGLFMRLGRARATVMVGTAARR